MTAHARSRLLHLAMAIVALMALAGIFASAQTSSYSIINEFSGTDGSSPVGNLIADSAGNLYGVTQGGGTSTVCPHGCGTVFKLSPTSSSGWQRTVLYEFTGTADGNQPLAGLAMDSAGKLYGTTYQGGVHARGVVFELSPTSSGFWKETVLHAFQGFTAGDGQNPISPMVFDSSGNLYGTTTQGGVGNCGFGAAGCGAVFELSPNLQGGWTETVIYSFGTRGGLGDGLSPEGPLVFDSQGALYGTTFQGGSLKASCGYPYYGCGIVFKLSLSAGGHWTKTTVHNFRGLSDGGYPTAGVIFDSAGNLYGAASAGGLIDTRCINGYGTTGCGVVFSLKLKPAGWEETVLFNFEYGATGRVPSGTLTFDAAGNLYGAATQGGVVNVNQRGQGVIFELSPSTSGTWTQTVLHTFNGSDGSGSTSNLILDSEGNIFGTAGGPGPFGNGLVFEIKP
jgi:uncharacterized repeat protein (TIGR03803 family)